MAKKYKNNKYFNIYQIGGPVSTNYDPSLVERAREKVKIAREAVGQPNAFVDDWNRQRLDTGRFDDQLGNGLIDIQKSNRDSAPIYPDKLPYGFNSYLRATPLIKSKTMTDEEAEIKRIRDAVDYSRRLKQKDIDAENSGAQTVILGEYNPTAHTIYNGPKGGESNLLHEQAHASKAVPQENKISEIFGTKNTSGTNYYDRPTEIYSRLMQFRQANNLDPTEIITKERLKGFKKSAIDFNLLNRYKDDQLLQLFNDVAYVDTPLNNDVNFAAYGGKINKFDLGGPVGGIVPQGHGKPSFNLNSKIDPSKVGIPSGGSGGGSQFMSNLKSGITDMLGNGAFMNSVGNVALGFLNPNGNSTGVGNAMQSIGGLASNIPGVGGLVGAGLGFAGGLVNAAFGSKINEENVAQFRAQNQQQANYTSNASTNEELLADFGSMQHLGNVARKDVGSDGWFSNKAKNLTRKINAERQLANKQALFSLGNTAQTVDTTNDLLKEYNYVAYGGPIDMKYTGTMSPFGNQFKDGGIYIKPENRGKFTALKERTGKSATWFKEHGTPSQKKMATFELNAKKWKHEYGGPVSSSENVIIPMIAETALDFTPIIGDVKGLTYDVYQGYKDEGLKGAAINAGLGLIGLIPFVGDTIKTSVKIGKKTNKLAKIVDKVIDYSKLTDEEWDDLYNKALKSGDKIELQRLRDAHFRVKAPNTKIVDNEGNLKPVYRGDKESHNVLRENHIDNEVGDMQGIYTTFDKKYAMQYGDVNSYYVNSGAPLYTKGSWTGVINKQVKDDILDDGYDLVINENFDNTSKILDPFVKKRTENILFDNTKIKSTNPVTYDDTGNIIPLSKRDNFNSSDIRYGFIPIGLGGLGLSTLDSNQKAFGGELTHGGIFNNGVQEINTGGTHEQNPYEGIQVGIDEQNVPNLVEEGELIWNDYVFSNRLNVPKSVRQKYKLRNTKDLKFAEAAKELQKESEERPNDPISKNGLNASLSDLANEQEYIRMKKEQRQNTFAYGGSKGNMFDGTGDKSQKLKTYRNYTQLPQNTDFYTPLYMNFWNWMDKNRDTTEAKNWLSRINSGEFGNIGGNTFNMNDIMRLSHDYKRGPVHNAFELASSDFERDRSLSNLGIFNQKAPTIKPITIFEEELPEEEEIKYTPEKSQEKFKESPLRYAPIVGHAAGVISDIFSKPDYQAADEVRNIELNPSLVGFTPIGNKLRFTPYDINFQINKANANAGASRRNIMNTSGGNRAAAMAGLMGVDTNYYNALGDAYRQALQYNDARRDAVETFNRATDQFNSEMELKASMANAESRNAMTKARYERDKIAALLGQQARDAYNTRRSNNLNILLEDIGNLGKERNSRNWADVLASRGVIKMDSKGEHQSNKNGGKLNRKKKGGWEYA